MKTLPNLDVVATNAQHFNLQDLKGKIVILYFYPKDNTPGCTQETADFRDHFAAFKKAGAIIYGISRDSLTSHERFKKKLELPFELIADTDEKLCKHFEIVKPKIMFGKICVGIQRTTFVFDTNGKLVREWRKVSVKGHIQDVLSTVQELAKKG